MSKQGKKNDPQAFAEAATNIAATEQKGYLGDPKVIQSLLRRATSSTMRFIESDEVDAKRKEEHIAHLCRSVAYILLGRHKNYTPMRGWNKPGAIDEFLAKWVGSSEQSAWRRTEHAVLKFLTEMIELAEYAGTEGVLDEQWEWQVDAILERYTSLFMGISPPLYEAMQ